MFTEIFTPHSYNHSSFIVEFVSLVPKSEESSVVKMIVSYKGEHYELTGDPYGETFSGTVAGISGVVS